jgi:hypothetical protein
MQDIQPNTPYHVVDCRTGAIVKTYTWAKRNAARRYVDKLDAAYGAVRYTTRLERA